MKKMLIILSLISGLMSDGISQSYDDRLVSRNLNVNTTEPQYENFVTGFREGAQKVKNGEIQSMDDIAQQTGVDIRTLPTLDDYVNGAVPGNVCSNPFLVKIRSLVDNAESFGSVQAIRGELVRISQSGNMNQKDQEALALIDIAAQEIEKLKKKGSTSLYNGSVSYGNDFLNGTDTKLPVSNQLQFEPEWFNIFVCIFGTIGSAITMAISGGTLGGTIGSLAGPAGTATGAVVGAVIGGIGGTITGILKYCR